MVKYRLGIVKPQTSTPGWVVGVGGLDGCQGTVGYCKVPWGIIQLWVRFRKFQVSQEANSDLVTKLGLEKLTHLKTFFTPKVLL